MLEKYIHNSYTIKLLNIHKNKRTYSLLSLLETLSNTLP